MFSLMLADLGPQSSGPFRGEGYILDCTGMLFIMTENRLATHTALNRFPVASYSGYRPCARPCAHLRRAGFVAGPKPASKC